MVQNSPFWHALQVYINLLRSNHIDSRRQLVRQALDILTPVIAAHAKNSDTDKTLWAKYLRKLLFEETHSLQQLTHIWQLIVRHAEIFYPLRYMSKWSCKCVVDKRSMWHVQYPAGQLHKKGHIIQL